MAHEEGQKLGKGSAAELLSNWRAAERDRVAAEESASVASLAAAAASEAQVAATETAEAARLSLDAAQRAEKAARRTAEAAGLAAATAQRDSKSADAVVLESQAAEEAARSQFLEAQASGFPKADNAS
jgi:hypothetical protein